MPSEVIVLTLLRAQIAMSLGLLVAMALRGAGRRLIGPGLAYRLWALGPAAALTSLFPTLAEFIRQATLFRSVAVSGSAHSGWRAVMDSGFWAGPAQP